MVVRIEPLGHFQRRLRGVAAREFVVLGERQRFRIEAEARRQRAEQRAQVEHLIVVSEIADGDEIQLRILLLLPVARTQGARNATQMVFIGFAAPERFLREFQFALGADARKAGDMRAGHVKSCCPLFELALSVRVAL
ncbi:hypothetical protein A6V37_37200 [Paraburkholderia ginsengiterrae]|uniref:Uncharacterized protein n=1 Tax=Paraburkholderia ginsengiterrae TaxID=1462993 RepID=A0A1A9MVZ9_9BURK|nr:hypothetical protein A6V37_37200 [Paraburkholderia ginsengiterrae]